MLTFFRRRGVKIILGITATLILFLLLLPVGIKYYLIDWLVKNGAESASIETLRYNPFLGRITLGGLDIQGGQRSILNHSSLVIDVGISSLFKRDIRFEKAEYSDLFIDMEQYENGNWRYGSFTVESGKKEEKALNPPDATATGPQWGFRADNVLIHNCSVHLKTPDVDMTLLIEQAELNRFTTREGEKAGVLSLTGKIDDSPITIQLDTLQITPDFRVDGKVNVANFDLHELAKLLEAVLPELNGMFGINGKVLFTMSDAQGINADYDGAITIAKTNIGSKEFTNTSESITWNGTIKYAAPADGPAKLATEGLLAVRNLNLQLPAAKLSLKNSAIDLEGKTDLTIADNISLTNDGSLSVKTIDLQQAAFKFKDESLTWKGQVAYEVADTGDTVRTAGSLDLDAVHFSSTKPEVSLDFQSKKVSWKGDIGVVQKDGGKKTTLEIDGKLLGNAVHTSVMEPPLRLDQARLNVQTKTTISLGDKLNITGKSSAEIESFLMQQGQESEVLSVGFDKLTLAGLENKGATAISLSELRTVNITAGIPGNLPMNVTIPELHITNIFTDDLTTANLGSFELKELKANSTKNGQELATLGQLTMNNISSGSKTLFAAQDLAMSNLTLFPSKEGVDQKSFLSLTGASINTLSWGREAGLQGGTLSLKTLIIDVNRDKKGEMNFNQQLKAMQLPVPEGTAEKVKTAAATPANEAKPAASPPITIAAITISDDSTVSFTDKTLAVPYSTKLNISEFFIKNLDSSQPDKKADFLLDGTLEKNAPLKISGKLALFKQHPDVNLDLMLKNYPLTSLSSYTVQSIGTALKSGRLRLKSTLALANNTIDLKNNVVLIKLKTDTIAPDLAAELNNQLPVPLDAALSMMRDSDENITLDIPISGPLDDINVGISQIIIKALNKSIVTAASSYFVYALGPYAALAYVGMKVGENMLQVNLPPIIYQPHENVLTEDHKGYLERIAKILKDRPDTDLRLNPFVASWELSSDKEKAAEPSKEIQKQLLELGQQRAADISKYLIATHGIDKTRLLAGDTILEKKKAAKPRVQLEIK